MKYYLIFDPSDSEQAYAIAQDNPKRRSRWASSISSLFINLDLDRHLPDYPEVPTQIEEQNSQILAIFDSRPTLALLESTHPELLL